MFERISSTVVSLVEYSQNTTAMVEVSGSTPDLYIVNLDRTTLYGYRMLDKVKC